MKRKVIVLLLALSLILALPLTAAGLDPISRFRDEAGLIPITEEPGAGALEHRMLLISQKYQMDVAILTVDNLGGMSAETYADDYYDSCGYGFGTNYSGLLLLIAMDERTWAVSTCGDAIRVVTDDEIDKIMSMISGKLSDGEYYEAFDSFLTQIEAEYEAYADETTLDIGDIFFRLAIALLIGAAIAGIALLIMRGKMNTAKSQHGAQSYIQNGSFDLFRCQDIYLYSRTTRTRKAENNSSGGTHRSSSGRSHGGSSGRF